MDKGKINRYYRHDRSEKMAVDYSKLWKRCIDKRITKMQLKEAAHISYNAVAKMGKNEPVSLETLEKVCRVLECNVGDIVEFDIDAEGEANK